jgi:hypothetical protein
VSFISDLTYHPHRLCHKLKSDPSVAFGELLRKRRTEQKMSQDALAAKASYERGLYQSS